MLVYWVYRRVHFLQYPYLSHPISTANFKNPLPTLTTNSPSPSDVDSQDELPRALGRFHLSKSRSWNKNDELNPAESVGDGFVWAVIISHRNHGTIARATPVLSKNMSMFISIGFFCSIHIDVCVYIYIYMDKNTIYIYY